MLGLILKMSGYGKTLYKGGKIPTEEARGVAEDIKKPCRMPTYNVRFPKLSLKFF